MSAGQDPVASARALLEATEALTAVLTEESEALAAHDGLAVRAILLE
jgi:hypothetical protein